MTYTPNIPQATDNPSASQSQILGNFQQLNIQYGTSGDHIPFTASSNNGKHNQVTWINQTANLPIVPTSNELIAFGVTNSGITMPYYVRDTISSATTLFPMSPIKAYCTFAITGAAVPYSTSVLDGFNIASISVIAPAQTIQITLTNAMRSTNYGVLSLSQTSIFATPAISYAIIDASNFTIGRFGSAISTIITVLAMET